MTDQIKELSWTEKAGFEFDGKNYVATLIVKTYYDENCDLDGMEYRDVKRIESGELTNVFTSVKAVCEGLCGEDSIGGILIGRDGKKDLESVIGPEGNDLRAAALTDLVNNINHAMNTFGKD